MPSKRSPITKKYCVSPAKALGRKGAKRGGRLQASGFRKTAKQPYTHDGTFRGWWMILLRAQSRDCFCNQQRYPSRTTASRTLRPALAFMSVHQRSAFCISVHEYPLAVGAASEYPPDLQEEAVRTVLMQAELLCADWSDPSAADA